MVVRSSFSESLRPLGAIFIIFLSLFYAFATQQRRHYVFGLSVRHVRLFVRSFVRSDRPGLQRNLMNG